MGLPRYKNPWTFSLFCSYSVRVYYVDFFVFFVLRHWRVSQVLTPPEAERQKLRKQNPTKGLWMIAWKSNRFSYLAFIINTYNLVLTYIHHIFRSRVDQSSRKHMFYARLAASCFWKHRIHHVEVYFREGLWMSGKGGKYWIEASTWAQTPSAFTAGRYSWPKKWIKTRAAAKFILPEKQTT